MAFCKLCPVEVPSSPCDLIAVSHTSRSATAATRTWYELFLTLWENADPVPDIPGYRKTKANTPALRHRITTFSELLQAKHLGVLGNCASCGASILTSESQYPSSLFPLPTVRNRSMKRRSVGSWTQLSLCISADRDEKVVVKRWSGLETEMH